MEFTYQARTAQGEARSGVIEARSLDAAVESLQRANLIVTEIVPSAKKNFLELELGFLSRVRQKDLVIFSRQFSTLFQAKVPITQSLRTLGSESESRALRETISAIYDDVASGSALSQAMARHPSVFSRFYIAMIRAGEESGKLEEVFLYLADYLDRAYALTSKARSSLMYPAFVFFAFIGVIVVMMTVVIPKLTTIFEELGQEVPFYTAIVIGTSNFLVNWGFLILIMLAAAGIAGWRWAQTERGAFLVDAAKLKIPLIAGLLKKIYLARLSDNISTLISAGIPIIRALEITSDVIGNRVYQAIVLDAAEAVKAGNTISAAFDRYREIPPLITQMIRIGEESGRLDFILKSAAAFYQRDVDNMLENFVSLIEPVLIIFLGAGVGLLVAAVLVPLYNLSTVI